jgi:hypothetical protein
MNNSSFGNPCPWQLLEDFAIKVCTEHYPQHLDNYNLKQFFNTTDFARGGFTGHTIGFLNDAQGSLIAVLKGYLIKPEDAECMRVLIPACDILRQLPVKHSSLALPMSTVQYQHDGKLYQIIATAAAHGTSITDYIKAVVHPETTTQEDRFNNLRNAVSSLARALAELHTLSVQNDLPIAPYFINSENSIIGYFLDLLEAEPKRFPFQADTFKALFIPIFQAANLKPLLSGYVHGDSNITNIFYSSSSNHITFVDTMTLFHAIDSEGRPRGNIIQDYIFCQGSLQLYCHYYGCSTVISTVVDRLFALTYAAYAPKIVIDSHQQRYYKLYHWITTAKTVDGLMHYRPAMRQSLETMFKYTLKQIQSCL